MNRIPKHYTRILLILVLYDIFLVFLYIVFKNLIGYHSISAWLFDDEYVLSNGLEYYTEFRPGYPPIGKMPYTLLYMLSNGNDIPILLYNILSLDLSIAAILYLMKLLDERKVILSLLFFIFNPLIIITALTIPHSDFLALTFMVTSLISIFRRNSFLATTFIALGFLTKIYPVYLLVPAITIFNGRDRIKLLFVFTSIVWIASLPFIVKDPLMYATTYFQHLSRGPSESLASMLEGYFGHTGFLHPTFDATIYYWQFIRVYNPSPLYHFNYEWRYPFLKHLSTLIWIPGLALCSFVASRVADTVDKVKAITMAVIIPIVLSPTYNCLMSIPLYTLTFVLLAKSSQKIFVTFSSLLAIVTGLHAISWSTFYHFIEFTLYVVVSYQALILATLFVYMFRVFVGERQ